MKTIIVSDLHLGAGDALEDFLVWGPQPDGPAPASRAAAIEALDAAFARFLISQMNGAREAHPSTPPRLVLLGDTFDLWQVQRDRETPAAALERIIGAHPALIQALRRWTADGGHLTVVLGNHDQPLMDPAAWGALVGNVPAVNHLVGGGPVHHLSDPVMGLYAEHGHQWDPFNRLRGLHRPDADCPGRRIVRHVVNHVEPLLPLVDKGATVVDLVALLWRAGLGEGLPAWCAAVEQVLRLLGRAAGPVAMLAGELEHWLADRRHTPDFTAVEDRREALQSRQLRRITRPGRRPGTRRNGTIGALPTQLRFVVSGHTHQPRHEQWRHRGRPDVVEHLNPGTWRPIVRPASGGALRVEQQPTAVVIEPTPASTWQARVIAVEE